MTSRRELRAAVRARRRALAHAERERLAEALARRAVAALLLRRVRRVACYLANDGEMDLRPLVNRLWAAGKLVYLPSLHGDALWFLPVRPASRMLRNRFGIPEPDVAADARVAACALDLVLVPLVAFDGDGNRLGMGGGFYDRTFAYLARRRHWRKPRLIGIAYGFQRLESLPTRPWDVPLEGVLTERGLERFAGRRAGA